MKCQIAAVIVALLEKKYGECNIECATVLEDIILKEGPDTVGSVVLEPITAGGGVIPPVKEYFPICLLYTSPSPRDMRRSRMPSSA